MCGIIGYLGKNDGVKVVLEGLKELEYRGYDSAGIAVLDKNNNGQIIKQVGGINKLETKIKHNYPDAKLAIGHTRWATHGKPSLLNSHPHSNQDRTIFVVHNGIVENYLDIKKSLEAKGYQFISETDSEVIPNLIDYYFKKLKDFNSALISALKDIKGTYALAIISTLTPEKIYLARLGSPLVVGKAKNEYIIASDANVLTKYTKKVTYLNDYDIAEISKNNLSIHNLKSNTKNDPKFELLDLKNDSTGLGKYPNFMLKEIFEIPETISLTIKGRVLASKNIIKLGGLDNVIAQLEHIDRIIIIGCGTSYYAGLVGEYLIEELAGIPVEVQLASEFKYRKEPISRSTCIIAISQSGETADTVAALNKVKDFGVLTLGVVNVIGSTISRMTSAGVYCHAGSEKAVASTKAYTAQITVLTMIALRLGQNTKLNKSVLQELPKLPNKINEILNMKEDILKLAQKYKKSKGFIYMGRGYNYPCALEGALKLKEISYIHAEGFAAGELKHGPLALIDSNLPTFVIAPNNRLYEKIYSNLQEIKARGGPIIALTSRGNTSMSKIADDVIYIPKTLEQTEPILNVIVLQLFAYFVSVGLGLNVDKPRNLAKSVTVE